MLTFIWSCQSTYTEWLKKGDYFRPCFQKIFLKFLFSIACVLFSVCIVFLFLSMFSIQKDLNSECQVLLIKRSFPSSINLFQHIFLLEKEKKICQQHSLAHNKIILGSDIYSEFLAKGEQVRYPRKKGVTFNISE